MNMAINATNDPPMLLLRPAEAAKTLQISPRVLWARSAPRGDIPVVKIGRSIRYSVAALEMWIAQQQEVQS
jgi:hypothetical protein